MLRNMGILAIAVALSGCETPMQGASAPSVATPVACTPQPFTLADGRSVQRTCKTYRGCTTFAADVPGGARSSALPFFVMTNGQPTSQYPGAGNCL